MLMSEEAVKIRSKNIFTHIAKDMNFMDNSKPWYQKLFFLFLALLDNSNSVILYLTRHDLRPLEN
jgi:hypothetical protein